MYKTKPGLKCLVLSCGPTMRSCLQCVIPCAVSCRCWKFPLRRNTHCLLLWTAIPETLILHLLQPVKKTFSQRTKRKNSKDLAQKSLSCFKDECIRVSEKRLTTGGPRRVTSRHEILCCPVLTVRRPSNSAYLTTPKRERIFLKEMTWWPLLLSDK